LPSSCDGDERFYSRQTPVVVDEPFFRLANIGDQALDAILQEPIQGRLEGAIRLFRAGDKRAVKEARGRGTPRLDSSRTTIYGKESRCNATTLMRMTVLTHW
jgi:hypothetical protein